MYLDNRSEPLYFTAKDISAGGVFLQTDPGVLPLNGLVGLTFPICGREQRVLAVVRRRTRSGAGLAFVNSRSEMTRIRELLPELRSSAGAVVGAFDDERRAATLSLPAEELLPVGRR